MPYILQSLMISCFPLAIHYCYCLHGRADRKRIQRQREAHLSTDNGPTANNSAPAAVGFQDMSNLGMLKNLISFMTALRGGLDVQFGSCFPTVPVYCIVKHF